ncbi:putative cell wall-binding protein [Leifsonia sp. AK011]|uniref:cell wall-binding repeat-containing protein n=1 Tax=Leifsonia sp. AK011 TaxID=2723075 RepID=UPI0018368CAC|nr:cell wall-binding repeat-containing protein [Leifsonia sp. AK011]NYF09833.1 putative cell wall-binding protein [Leifsonia sp. AK011]
MPLSHRFRRILGTALVASVATGALVATPLSATAAEDEDLASRFTFAVLPDTQFYSRYSPDQFHPRYGADPYEVQTQWLADHADDLDIPFVAHLGDIVDRVGTNHEWVAADTAMKNLENANVPYSILAGNHDVRNSNDQLDDTSYNLSNEPFLTWFGVNRRENLSTYEGSDPTGFSQYHIFEAEGQQFMVLALPWRASDATMAWADAAMAAHPTLPVILTTHSLLNIAPDGISPLETEYGLELWDKLIRSNDQIFMTLNGHFHGATQLVKTNDAGHPVYEILMDYQMAYEGGNGYLGLFEFDLTNNLIDVQTASPWVTWKPQETLTAYDQPFLENSMQKYTIPFNFAERFAGFTSTFTAGPADSPSLTKKARDILLDGFEGPDAITTEFPGNELDYPEVDGTLAHWRFNGLDGVVDGDTVIPDVYGDNDMHRVDPATTNAVGSTWGDVTVESDDVHGYSSDGAAVCFADSNQTTNRFSYLSTAADAAVNNSALTGGFTIETFVKMDENWDATANGWSKAVVHTGNRSQIPGFARTQWDWTASPTALGISNLREFQWTAVPGDPTKGDKTNWSGEIMTGAWSHVAVVGDPSNSTYTMYVDGAPVLRNAVNALGLAENPNMPWILGADWVDNAAKNGWNGCIGETRIIDHATTPDQWLTQRADLTGLAVTQAPTGELSWNTDSVEISGTGFAGAEVRVRDAKAEQVASTMVAEDGTWSVEVAGFHSGDAALSVVQGLGARESEAIAVSFSIADLSKGRIAGANRYDTAVKISQQSYPDTAPVVYIADGTKYPDALSAGPAAAFEGGPLLLVEPSAIPGFVAAEIERLAPQRIVVVGGTPSVSADVYAQLDTMADEITRLGGANRYETSRMVADYAFGDAGASMAYLATGTKFPDALAAGGAAGAQDAPVILVNGSAFSLDSATRALLDSLGTTDSRVLGDTNSISEGIFEDANEVTNSVRLAGANRFQTARVINADAFDSADRAFLSTGENFPDALAGSAWAGSEGAPLFTVRQDCVPQGVLDDLIALGVSEVVLLGGTPSLSENVFALTPCA